MSRPPSQGDPDDPADLLTPRQQTIYRDQITRFEEYLRTEGKEPKKNIGYADDSVTERLSRFQRVVEWIWTTEEVTTEITPRHANRIVDALNTDELRMRDGGRYAGGSKRKINNVLKNWFEFQGIDWEPEVTFTDESSSDNADPYTKRELRLLWQSALEYNSVPSYNNLSPEDRDRWKAHLAQELGKPKADVSPDDWETINRSWKIPSLIRTTREAGWRPALIERMSVDWYDEASQTIVIPEGQAVKNDDSWDQKLSDEAAMTTERWLEQRRIKRSTTGAAKSGSTERATRTNLAA